MGDTMTAAKVVVPVEIENGSAISSVKEVKQEIETMKTELGTLKEQGLAGVAGEIFGQDYLKQIETAERHLNNLLNLRQKITDATNANDRANALFDFRRNRDYTKSLIEDLRGTAASASKLFGKQDVDDVASEMMASLHKGIAKFIPDIAKQFVAFEKGWRHNNEGRSSSTDDLIKQFKHSSWYRQLDHNLRQNNGELSTVLNQDYDDIMQIVARTKIKKLYRSEFTPNTRFDPSAVVSIYDMLPTNFKGIELSKTPKLHKASAANDSLTQQELATLKRIVTENAYIRDEAKASGILHLLNGHAYINPEATRQHVNAFGGQLATLFASGAIGLPSLMHGDLANPNVLKKVAAKTNLSLTHSRNVAATLAEAFNWFQPEHIQMPKAQFDKNTWIDAGAFVPSPRQKTMEFRELDWRGQPIIEKRFDPANNETVEVERFTPVNYSLHQAKLAQTKGADRWIHNGRSSNEIMVKLPFDLLSDPNTSPETKEEIRASFENMIRNGLSGFGGVNAGHTYDFTAITPSHLAFTRRDIKQKIEEKDPYFFRGGDTRTEFTSKKDFLRSLEAVSKNRTEGESIEDLYGTDLSKLNVVVANLKYFRDQYGKERRLSDGQNWISTRLVPRVFQGRDLDGKATWQAFNFAGLWDLKDENGNLVYGDYLKKDGKFHFPGAGWNGGDLVIGPETDIIEDAANIKGIERYAGMTQRQINSQRAKDIKREGIFAKTTAEGAATQARYIPAQIAQHMVFGPEAQKYFRDIAMQEIEDMEDPEFVRQRLFNGNDALSEAVRNDLGMLNSPEARGRIASHLDSIFSHLGKNDVMIPGGGGSYAMLQAWFPDVLNGAIEGSGKKLTDAQKGLQLGLSLKEGASSSDLIDQVAYFQGKSDEVGLFRNPGTASGNIHARNKAVDETFRKYADILGVDKEALYVAPISDLMAKLQGADVDGDTAFVYALKHNKEFGGVMRKVLEDSIQAWRGLISDTGMDAEALERLKQAQGKADEFEEGRVWNSLDPKDISDVAVHHGDRNMGMGSASAAQVNARQYGRIKAMQRAILASEGHYDNMSIYNYKDILGWELTKDEWEALRGGRPLGEVMNWAMKSRGSDEPGANQKAWDAELFNGRPIDQSNLPSVHQGHVMNNQLAAYMLHTKYGVDTSGGFLWDEILGAAPMAAEEGSEAAKLTTRLREVRAKLLNKEAFGVDDSLVDELKAMELNASNEIARQVLDDANIKPEDKMKEFQRRLKAVGVGVADRIKEFGPTRSNLQLYQPEMYADALEFDSENGTNGFLMGGDYTISSEQIDMMAEAQKQVNAAKKQKEKNDQEIAKLREEEAKQQALVEQEQKEKQELAKQEADTAAKERTTIQQETQTNHEQQQTKEEQLANIRQSIRDKEKERSKSHTEQEDAKLRAEIAKLRRQATDIEKGEEAQKGGMFGPASGQVVVSKSAVAPSANEQALAATRARIQQLETNNSEQNNIIKTNQAIANGVIAYMQGDEEYRRVMNGAEEYLGEMRSSSIRRDKSLLDQTSAESYAAVRNARLTYMTQDLEALRKTDHGKQYEAEIKKLEKDLADATERDIISKGQSEVDKGLDYFTDLRKKSDPKYSKAQEEIDARKKRIDEMKGWQKVYEDKIKNGGHEEYKDELETVTRKIREAEAISGKFDEDALARETHLQEAALQHTQLQNDRMTMGLNQGLRNAQMFQTQRQNRFATSLLARNYLGNQMQYNQLLGQEEGLKQQIAEKEQYRQDQLWLSKNAEKQHDRDVAALNAESASDQLRTLNATLAQTQQNMEGLSGPASMMTAAMDTITQSVSRLVTQLGRRFLHKAIQEAIQFTKQFDASMRNIQAITMKSDDEMSAIRSQTVEKAISLRTSVSNVASVEQDLYRQGLSDAEVSDRTDAILKFAKVSGAKVQDATKIITTALQNGLVGSAEEAMDALTALGDSAATTATDIGKAMQKCAAAAKVAGVSYGELTSMLTIMTSSTQLSGTQIGTAMNTLLSRMRQVTTAGYVKDINGDTTDISAMETALRLAGVSLRDEKDGTKFRPTSEILLELSQKWNSFSDIQRSNLSTQLAGTRQGNMFSALMEGMASDNGEEYKRLLGLSENSEGITESKYEIQAKSLNAALETLKATYDGLVADLTEANWIQPLIDGITGIIQGIRNFVKSAPGVVQAIGGIAAAAVVLLSVIKSIGKPWAALGIAGGIAGAALITSGIGAISKGLQGQTDEEAAQAAIDRANNYASKNKKIIDDRRALIKETRELGEQHDQLEKLGQAMDKASQNKLAANLTELQALFPGLGAGIDDVSAKLKEWEQIVNGAEGAVNQMVGTSIETARILSRQAGAKLFDAEVQKELDQINAVFPRISESDIENARAIQITGDPGAEKQAIQSLQDEILQSVIAEVSEAGGAISQGAKESLFDIETPQSELRSKLVQPFVQIQDHRLLRGEAEEVYDQNINEYGKTEADALAEANKVLYQEHLSLLTGYNIIEKAREKYRDRLTNLYLDEKGNFDGGKYNRDYSILTQSGWDLFTQAARNGEIARDLVLPEDMESIPALDAVLKYIYDNNLLSSIDVGEYDYGRDAETFRQKFYSTGLEGIIRSTNEETWQRVMNTIYSYFNEDTMRKLGAMADEEQQRVLKEAVGNYQKNYVGEGTFFDDESGALAAGAYNFVLKKALEADNGKWKDKYGNLLYSRTNEETGEQESWVTNANLSQWYTEAYENLQKNYNPNDVEGSVRNWLLQWNPDALIYTIGDAVGETGYQTLEAAEKAIEDAVKADLGPEANEEAIQAEIDRRKWGIRRNGETVYNTSMQAIESSFLNRTTSNKDYRDVLGKVVAYMNKSGATTFEALMSGMDNEFGAGWADSSLAPMLNKYTTLANALGANAAAESAGQEVSFSNEELREIAYAELTGDKNFLMNSTLGRMEQAFGPGFLSEMAAGTYIVSEHQDDFLAWQGNAGNAEWLNTVLQQFPAAQAAVDALTAGTEMSAEAQRDLNAEIGAMKISNMENLSDTAQEAAEYYKMLHGSAKDAAKALKSAASAFAAVNKNQGARSRWRSGKRDKETVEEIAQLTELTKEQVESGQFDSIIETILNSTEAEDKQTIKAWGDAFVADMNTSLKTAIQGNRIVLDDGSFVEITAGAATVDFSQTEALIGSQLSAEQQAIIALFQQMGIKGHWEIDATGQNPTAQLVIDSLGSGGGGKSSGGGGGGGKSAAKAALEALKRQQEQDDHVIKMAQLQETSYEGKSQLTNLNDMLQIERQLQAEKWWKNYMIYIPQMKNQMAGVKEGSDDWNELADAIKKAEETMGEAHNRIEEIDRQLVENQQKIRQLRTELEDLVVKEIEADIQEIRDRLAGTVDMQSIILDAIKQRYQDEWDLIKRDIDKKKEALEEEKALIDERLQRRKDAEDEAEKYEELAELKRQLAMISLDSTRTKDAASMREKIAKLEKDIAWDLAEDEAKQQQQAIDDEIKAYDDLATNGDEDLQALLENANNFSTEVNNVLHMNQEELFAWLKDNVMEYSQSLDEMQQQMVQGWEDTFKQMYGIVDTYWAEVNDIMSNKEKFIEFMTSTSNEYIYGSDEFRAYFLQDLSTRFDNYLASHLDDNKWAHSDEFSGGTAAGGGTGSGGGAGSKNGKNNNNQNGLTEQFKNAVGEGSHGYEVTGYIVTPAGNSQKLTKYVKAESPLGAKRTAKEYFGELRDIGISQKYKYGGLVNFTGPAWVDGSKQRPEAFLSADDTALMRELLDIGKSFRYRPAISNIDSTSFTKSGWMRIETLNVNIQEAQLKEDADYELVAQRVGQAFAKELSRNGYNTANYNF